MALATRLCRQDLFEGSQVRHRTTGSDSSALQGGGITPGRAVADLRALEEILAAQSGRQSHLSERQFAELKRLVQALRTALSPVHQPTRNSRTQSSSGATAASTNLWNTYGEFESWGLRRRRS